MQIKLLNNIQRLNVEMQRKDIELKSLHKIVNEKNEQIEQMEEVEQKIYAKLRKMKEDLYDAKL